MDWTPLVRAAFLAARHDPDEEVVEELTQHAAAAYEQVRAEGADHDTAVTHVEALIAACCRDAAALRRRARRPPLVEAPAAAGSWLFGFARDLQYSTRLLRRQPGFALVAMLTLAVGIGASTAIFSVVDAVLLRALPYPKPQQIVRVWEQSPTGRRMNLATSNFDDFLAQNDTFESLAAYDSMDVAVAGGTEPVRVNVADVSSGFFRALGVEPFRGRTFAPEEQRVHGAPAVIVSYGFWQRYLGGTSDLSKVHLSIGGAVYPVIGVMPAGVEFPADASAWVARERSPQPPGRTGHNWRGLGRLRDGVTLAQARANLGTIARRIKAQYGKAVDLEGAIVVPLADAIVGDVRTALLTLLGGVGLLLLVACANVASLLLARTSARRKELAIRAALGAGRGRLTQQFLAESLVLSCSGGALGILAAAWIVKVLPAILPANLPRQHGIAMNTPVLVFACAIILAVAVSLGLVAAWRAASGDLQHALTAGSRSYAGSAATQRFRGVLVVAEIATTLVILVGAGLLGRSFMRLIATSPGFSDRNLITIAFARPNSQELWMQDAGVARQVQVMDQILGRLRTIPGVEAVGLAGAVPVAAGDNLPEGDFLILDGRKPPASFGEWGRLVQNRSQVGHALYAVADAEYFPTMGIPLVRGRLFDGHDNVSSPHVAVISESLARQRWPGEDPIGRVIDFGNMDGTLKPLTIVGIGGDVRARGLNLPASAIIYVDYRQRGLNANAAPTILVRSAAPPREIASAARSVFHDLLPDVPVTVSTFADEMGGWLADRRFLLLLVGVFAAAALALAAVGIYGVVAFSVTRRTREIGLRIALGAQRRDVLRMILREGLRMAVVGVTIGIAASLAITRLMTSLLFGTSTTDPPTFAAVAALLCAVALLASYVPARRAMRLDPDIALRCE
jgi:putative ABC transport system permease protein